MVIRINKKEKYKGQFNTVDTEIKAYFLGFAYGDGHNGKLKRFGSENSYTYKFLLASTELDKEVLVKFAQEFPFLKLGIYPSHPGVLYLENYEKQLYEDLHAIGMPQNKMKADKKGEFNFPDIDNNLIPHFIRGFFDSDGSVWHPRRHRSRNNTRVGFGLGTKNFCLELKAVLDAVDIPFRYIKRDKKCSNGKYYTSHELLSSSRMLSNKFAEYIYKDATIFLQRKMEKFQVYEMSEKQKKSLTFPLCTCGSRMTSNGTRNGKQRLKCKSCNKHISVLLPPAEEIL